MKRAQRKQNSWMPTLLIGAVALAGAALITNGMKEKGSRSNDSAASTTPLYFEPDDTKASSETQSNASAPVARPAEAPSHSEAAPGLQRSLSSVPRNLHWTPPSSEPSKMDMIRSHLKKDEIEDLNSIAQIMQKEKTFLLNELRLPETKIQEIQDRRKALYQNLKGAKHWASSYGLTPKELQRSLLSKHVSWMENQIGVGNYARLQDLALEP